MRAEAIHCAGYVAALLDSISALPIDISRHLDGHAVTRELS